MTCDVIMAKRSFISKERFAKCVEIQKKEEEVLNWIKLDEETLYRINKIEPKVSVKYGDCFILHIESEQGEVTKVWGPERLVRKIKEKRKSNEAVYFVSLGQERANKKTYNNFDLMFEKDVEHEIFIENEQ